MALYEYRCQECNGIFEVLKKMIDMTPEECPLCRQTNTIKLMSAPGLFNLKGKGFFCNDYPKKRKEK